MPYLKPRWYAGAIAVRGNGPFPFDMLRYDSCYPTTPEDVAKMFEEGQRIIYLTMHASTLENLNPTKERWLSFRWEAS